MRILLKSLFNHLPGGPNIAAPATTSSPSSPSVQREVVNIVVDKIEGASIYSKDVEKFEIPSSAKVIDNSHRETKMRTAELVFENGRPGGGDFEMKTVIHRLR